MAKEKADDYDIKSKTLEDVQSYTDKVLKKEVVPGEFGEAAAAWSEGMPISDTGLSKINAFRRTIPCIQ